MSILAVFHLYPEGMRWLKLYKIARKLLGVPYVHQGRNAKYGVDCGGVLFFVLKELGRKPIDAGAYNSFIDFDLIDLMKKNGFRQVENGEPGDVAVIKIKGYPQHLVILSDTGIIHCHAKSGTVIETAFLPVWKKRVFCFFRLESD